MTKISDENRIIEILNEIDILRSKGHERDMIDKIIEILKIHFKFKEGKKK